MLVLVKEAFGVGETINLAQEDARRNLALNNSNQEINYEIVQMPIKKTLGIFGGKQAKVKASVCISPAKVAASYVEDILKEFGLKDFKIEISEGKNSAELTISGERISPIIGRRGRLLDNIQYLAGLVANSGERDYFRLTINAGDYRSRREKTLESLAEKIAMKALRTGKALNLEPMSPYERRVIHLKVESIDGVKSWSEGEGKERHIVISAENPENIKPPYKNHNRKFNSNDFHKKEKISRIEINEKDIPLYGKVNI